VSVRNDSVTLSLKNEILKENIMSARESAQFRENMQFLTHSKILNADIFVKLVGVSVLSKYNAKIAE
jgi:hypothetical protein